MTNLKFFDTIDIEKEKIKNEMRFGYMIYWIIVAVAVIIGFLMFPFFFGEEESALEVIKIEKVGDVLMARRSLEELCLLNEVNAYIEEVVSAFNKWILLNFEGSEINYKFYFNKNKVNGYYEYFEGRMKGLFEKSGYYISFLEDEECNTYYMIVRGSVNEVPRGDV